MSEFLHEVLHHLSDPAHFAAEFVYSIIIDIFLFGLVVPVLYRLARRRTRRDIEQIVEARVKAEHHIIDAEHGVPAHD